MKSTIAIVVRVLFIFACVCSSYASAIAPIYTGGATKLAIKGYDPVAYFTQQQAIKGLASYQVTHQGAVWQFASKEHQQMFVSDPEKYMPQYGGYCAYAVSRNTTASIKPKYFTLHEGKLYLNYNKVVMKKWLMNKEKNIQKANATWPKLVQR